MRGCEYWGISYRLLLFFSSSSGQASASLSLCETQKWQKDVFAKMLIMQIQC